MVALDTRHRLSQWDKRRALVQGAFPEEIYVSAGAKCLKSLAGRYLFVEPFGGRQRCDPVYIIYRRIGDNNLSTRAYAWLYHAEDRQHTGADLIPCGVRHTCFSRDHVKSVIDATNMRAFTDWEAIMENLN